MKKKEKILVILLIVTTVLAISFFTAVRYIRESQKINIETEGETNSIEDYKTGEFVTIHKAYEEAGVKEITSVTISCNKDIEGFEDEKLSDIYFLKNPELIKRVVDVMELEKFEKSNTPFENMKNVEFKWSVGLIYDDEKSINISAFSTEWKDICLCNFSLQIPGIGIVTDDQFMLDYYWNGVFLEDDVTEVLLDILNHDIQKISLEGARELVENQEVPVLNDFRQYYYGNGYGMHDNMLLTLPLKEEKGEVQIEYSLAPGELLKIFCITYVNEEENYREVLYETER